MSQLNPTKYLLDYGAVKEVVPCCYWLDDALAKSLNQSRPIRAYFWSKNHWVSVTSAAIDRHFGGAA
ncbi:hypothetical protein IQ266_18820 [filamentous cyanobacterium LEGE 11480]|uniref:Uncharacterized protein n=1 Tax=Romeriopsis navalis LEGE 11480 TaxID=2777977 RepID=A0A928VNI9_9CYAN|nr:hypothetical protein [Romeriopsis navalis]MBE9031791.1 hypothetical protein [Romeriopsis navalis LEGE 11480]